MRVASVALAFGMGSVALAAPTADSIHAPKAVRFGGHIVVSGQFANAVEGQPVEVRFREFGEPTFATLALVATDAAGRWRLSVRPTIATRYAATSLGRNAGPIAVGVRPLVTLRRRGSGFVVTVSSSASYEGRHVILQRRVGKRWKKLAKVVLRRRARRFDVHLPRGSSRVRAFLQLAQAGPGYLASASNVVSVRR